MAEVVEEVPRVRIFETIIKIWGDVESMLLQAQPTGTIVAKNLSAPTSSTPSARNGP